MSAEKLYVVPRGMINAAADATRGVDPEGYLVYPALEAAIRWLAENPIVPTPEQAHSIYMEKGKFPFDDWEWVRWGACEWQRRMFLAPEPEIPIPEALKDLLEVWIDPSNIEAATGINRRILEAWRRGKAAV